MNRTEAFSASMSTGRVAVRSVGDGGQPGIVEGRSSGLLGGDQLQRRVVVGGAHEEGGGFVDALPGVEQGGAAGDQRAQVEGPAQGVGVVDREGRGSEHRHGLEVPGEALASGVVASWRHERVVHLDPEGGGGAEPGVQVHQADLFGGSVVERARFEAEDRRHGLQIEPDVGDDVRPGGVGRRSLLRCRQEAPDQLLQQGQQRLLLGVSQCLGERQVPLVIGGIGGHIDRAVGVAGGVGVDGVQDLVRPAARQGEPVSARRLCNSSGTLKSQ